MHSHKDFRGKLLLFIFFAVLLTALERTYSIYIIFFFSLSCWILLPIEKWWDKISISLLFFSVFYSLMQVLNGAVDSGFNTLTMLLGPVSFYRFGKWLMSYYRTDGSRQKIFLFMLLAFLTPLFVKTIEDAILVGIINDKRVLLGDNIDGEDSLAATLYGLMVAPGLGCLSTIFARNQNMGIKIVFFLIGCLSLFVVIHLVNRTGIVVCASCLIVSFVASTKMRISKILPALLTLLFVVGILMYTGVFNEEIIEAYSKRELDSTYDAKQAGGRVELWTDALGKLFTHPFGWPLVHYAHNLWLDIARVSGLFALFPFLLVTLMILKSFIYLFMNKLSPFTLLLLSICFSMLLSSSVEPVIDGFMLTFLLLMLIWGCTRSVYYECKLANYKYKIKE